MGTKNMLQPTMLPVGTDVLLARSTGESKQYEILGRIHEVPTQVRAISAVVTPPTDNMAPTFSNFSADKDTYTFDETATFTWDYKQYDGEIVGFGIRLTGCENYFWTYETECDGNLSSSGSLEAEIDFDSYSFEYGEEPKSYSFELVMFYTFNDEEITSDPLALTENPVFISRPLEITTFSVDDASLEIGQEATFTLEFVDDLLQVDHYEIIYYDGESETITNTAEISTELNDPACRGYGFDPFEEDTGGGDLL